jgi:hypothetical protein
MFPAARSGWPVPVGPPVRAMVTGTTPPSAVDLHWRAANLVAGQSGTVAAAAEDVMP